MVYSIWLKMLRIIFFMVLDHMPRVLGSFFNQIREEGLQFCFEHMFFSVPFLNVHIFSKKMNVVVYHNSFTSVNRTVLEYSLFDIIFGERGLWIWHVIFFLLFLTLMFVVFWRRRIRAKKIVNWNRISDGYEEQKKLLHDYNNQIGAIQGLLKSKNYEEAKSYADRLAEAISEEPEKINVHHPVVNVVLNQKRELAREKKISLLLHANDLSGLWLEKQHLVILLSNLLDNAIEASEKMTFETGDLKDDNRVIQMKLIREDNEFVVSIKNPIKEAVVIENNRIQTTKKDKAGHGIGLQNIHRIVEYYGGMELMRCEDGYFYYTAIFPE